MEAVTAAVDAGADLLHQFAYVIDGTVGMATGNETTGMVLKNRDGAWAEASSRGLARILASTDEPARHGDRWHRT